MAYTKSPKCWCYGCKPKVLFVNSSSILHDSPALELEMVRFNNACLIKNVWWPRLSNTTTLTIYSNKPNNCVQLYFGLVCRDILSEMFAVKTTIVTVHSRFPEWTGQYSCSMILCENKHKNAHHWREFLLHAVTPILLRISWGQFLFYFSC